MSEARHTLRCLACARITYANDPIPEACPGCGSPWCAPGVAIAEFDAADQADGASILKEEADPVDAGPAMDPSTVEHHFMKTGAQYYASGRFAFLTVQHPVAGTLLHHGVEMLLKGGLTKAGVRPRKLRQMQHNLPKLWRLFRAKFPQADLSRFDVEVEGLHLFESLRYPDAIATKGLALGFSPGSRADGELVSEGGLELRVNIYLGDVDGLVAAIVRAVSIRPGALLHYMNDRAAEVVREGNAFPWKSDGLR